MSAMSKGGHVSKLSWKSQKQRVKDLGDGAYSRLNKQACGHLCHFSSLVDPMKFDIKSLLLDALGDQLVRKFIDFIRHAGYQVDWSGIKDFGDSWRLG